MLYEVITDLVEDEDGEAPRCNLLVGQGDGVLGVGAVLVLGVGVAVQPAEPLAGGVQLDQLAEQLDPVPLPGVEVLV